MNDDSADADSQAHESGSIPGLPTVAPFRAWEARPSAIPVLISVPHAGRAYPPSLLRNMRQPDRSVLKLEDRYVDRLAKEVARRSGAALLVAQAPRAMIDLNRAPEDIDWEMFVRGQAASRDDAVPSLRARSGLGLIPRRLPGIGELWRSRLDEQDLIARLDRIHEPYHAKLAAMVAALRDRWGAALLIDMHSMPPLPAETSRPAAEFVIGDRFGATCHGSLVGAAFMYLAAAGRVAAHNRPYAGGYVLERHAKPARGIHALQLEIDRSSYLDARLAEAGAGFDDVIALLTDLVRRLAGCVAELAPSDRGEWPLAAE